MKKVLFCGDGSSCSRALHGELASRGAEMVDFERAGQLEELLSDGVSAVVLVNPHTHASRAVRKALEKAGGVVSRTPVIAVLGDPAMLEEQDMLRYVDDFQVEPAGAFELAARVRMAETRRGGKGNVIARGPLLVNIDAHRVFLEGRPLDFTYKEFELLKMLASTPGRAYTREELLRSVWGYDYFGGTRTVDVHVRRLRAKIEKSERFIETVHGVGYRFTA